MKRFIALVIAAMLLVALFTGCYDRGVKADGKLDKRFTCVMHDDYHEIWKDNNTGVLYWGFYSNTHRGGVTVLLDKDGKPLLDGEVAR